jgi:hypothetical protein
LIRSTDWFARAEKLLLWSLGGALLLYILTTPWIKIDGIDSVWNLGWIQAFVQLHKQGLTIPHWLPESGFGLGSPTFYFYPPLAFHLAALLNWITGIADLSDLFRLESVIATLASIVTAYLFLSNFQQNVRRKWIGALLYGIAPYRLSCIYTRSGLGEHIGLIFLPLIFLYAWRTVEKQSFRDALFLGLWIAFTVLCNVPLALAVAVTCVVLGVVFFARIPIRGVVLLAFGGMVAALLVAFYLLPLLDARAFVNISHVWISNGELRKSSNLLYDLLHRENLTGLAQSGFLIAQCLILLWAVVRTQTGTDQVEGSLKKMVIAISLLILLINIPYLSAPLWRHLPPFTIIQFPWRFACMFVLMVSLFTCIVKLPVLHSVAVRLAYVSILMYLGFLTIIFFSLRITPHRLIAPGIEPPEYSTLHTPFVEKEFIADLERHRNDPPIILSRELRDDETIRLVSREPNVIRMSVSLDSAVNAVFHRFDWPFWKLSAGNRPLSTVADTDGLATATVPSGTYELRWELVPTNNERLGNTVSAVTFCLLIFYLFSTTLTAKFRSIGKFA